MVSLTAEPLYRLFMEREFGGARRESSEIVRALMRRRVLLTDILERTLERGYFASKSIAQGLATQFRRSRLSGAR